MKVTSRPVGTCLANLTLAKLPLPMVLISRYLPMCGSSRPRLRDDATRGGVTASSTGPFCSQQTQTLSNLAKATTFQLWHLESQYVTWLQTRFVWFHCSITRDVNTRVLGYPGPMWPTRVPTRVPWNQRSAQLPRSPSSKHWLPVWPHTGSRKRGAARVLIACW